MEHIAHTTPVNQKNWYDRFYKIALIVPVAFFIFSMIYLFSFYQTNGDLIYKDVSLTGGTSVTVFDKNVDAKIITDSLKAEFPDMQYRIISDFRTGEQHGFSIETQAESSKIVSALESNLNYKLDEKNS